MEASKELEEEINNLPGVVENGLFIGLATEVIIGRKDGIEVMKRGY